MNIQDYNARLENNNTNLNEILNTINNLPTLKLQDKSVTPTKEKQTITADETYNGLGSVSVEAIPSSYVEPSGTLEITENGTYDVTNYQNVATNIKGAVEKYTPAMISFQNYKGTSLSYEVSNLDTINMTNLGAVFNGCTNITSLNLNHWNTSNITSTSQLFNNCSKLQTILLSDWDVSNVTSMNNTFSNCSALKSLDIKNWNVSNATAMNNMFYYCSSLTTLDLSGWVTSKVTNMSTMFYGCTKLTHLDIRNFDFTKVTSYSTMFGNTASNGVPDTCEIIVKSETEKTWITSKFSRLTNIKTVAEL